MLVTCPACRTKYRAPHGRIILEQTRARCSRCGHVFVPSAADCQAEAPRPGGAPGGFPATRPGSSRKPASGGGVPQAPETARSGRITGPLRPQASKRKSSARSAAIPLALIIAVIAMAYSLYPRWMAVLPFPPLQVAEQQSPGKIELPETLPREGSLGASQGGEMGAAPDDAPEGTERERTGRNGPSGDRSPGQRQGGGGQVASVPAEPSGKASAGSGQETTPSASAAGRRIKEDAGTSSRDLEYLNVAFPEIAGRSLALFRIADAGPPRAQPGEEARENPSGKSGKPSPSPEIEPRPYSVVLASCRRKKSAMNVISSYRKRGLDPLSLGRVHLNESGKWWVVYLGRYETREAAAKAEKALQEDRRLMIKMVPYANRIDTEGRKTMQAAREKLVRLGYVPYAAAQGHALLVGAHRNLPRAREMKQELRSRGFQSMIVKR